jgi:hypothetical protein
LTSGENAGDGTIEYNVRALLRTYRGLQRKVESAGCDVRGRESTGVLKLGSLREFATECGRNPRVCREGVEEARVLRQDLGEA